MTFKSADSFRHFDQSVRRELRYVRTVDQEDFLAKVLETSRSRAVPLKAERILWRAQVGHRWRKERQGKQSFEVPAAYNPERMKPDPTKVSDGRANPRGIACLYLATLKTTAALEVRPSIGAYVSIAQFKLLRDVQLVDCSAEHMDNLARWLEAHLTPEDIEKAVWSDINDAFSEPVERGDSSLDYVPTLILARRSSATVMTGLPIEAATADRAKTAVRRAITSCSSMSMTLT